MRKTGKNKRPPWWFAPVLWAGIAGAAALMAAALGMATS